jgi:hypothetical protein
LTRAKLICDPENSVFFRASPSLQDSVDAMLHLHENNGFFQFAEKVFLELTVNEKRGVETAPIEDLIRAQDMLESDHTGKLSIKATQSLFLLYVVLTWISPFKSLLKGKLPC